MPELSRRQMLVGTGAVAAGRMLTWNRRARAASQAEIIDTQVISMQPDLYHGWPTLARRRNGQLVVAWSGGREDHICPFGRVEMMTSDDDGRTWTWPRVLLDSAIDDRDAGVVETARGALLVTTFTSLAYEPKLDKAIKLQPGEKGAWDQDRLERWRAAHSRLSAEQRKAELGCWMLRSTDGGVTFSARMRCPVNSPHGPIQLSDGRLLYAGKELWHGDNRVGVCESTDDGQTWRWLAAIPTRSGDDHHAYHELHAVEAADGRLVVQIRNHNKTDRGVTLQSESTNGGKTWTVPHSTGVWGYPSHLMPLKDDRLLMTYGHRRQPFGNQARVSSDHGRTWSEPMIISGHGETHGDFGYPTTVQLDDESLLTVWYERMKDASSAVLRQTRWSIRD